MIRKVTKMITMLLLLQGMQTEMIAQPQTVIMGGQYNEPNNETGVIYRSPIMPIRVVQDGGIFTFSSSFAGEVIEILTDDTIIYTSIIGDDGMVEIPESITGEVELRLVRGKVIYHASVTL